jgi:F-box interacting protein
MVTVMANELPEDLVTQILLLLPVVALLRFKSVCKSWYALITHQNFIRKHLLHNNNNNSNTLLLPYTIKDYVVSMLSYETLQVSLTQPLPPPYFGMGKKVKNLKVNVVGSCNGLVYLRDKLNFVIWNPATKETKIVPHPRLGRCRPITPDRFSGFGFDAKTNDYKVINVVSYYYTDLFISDLYSLRADSWREVGNPPRGPNSCIMPSCRVYAYDWEGVISFDMSDEVFLKTPVPDDVLNESKSFFVLRESIAMAVNTMEVSSDDDSEQDWSYDEACFDIWLLLEVGVKGS